MWGIEACVAVRYRRGEGFKSGKIGVTYLLGIQIVHELTVISRKGFYAHKAFFHFAANGEWLQ